MAKVTSLVIIQLGTHESFATLQVGPLNQPENLCTS